MNVKGDTSALIDGRYSLRDLVDVEYLREILEKFSHATGSSVALVTLPDEELLVATRWRDVCREFHQALPASQRCCEDSHQKLVAKLGDTRQPCFSLCEHGLVDGVTPIIIKGQHVANLFTGQVVFQPPDLSHFKKQAEEYAYDLDGYIAAVRDIPVVTEAQFGSYLAFLNEAVVLIANLGLSNCQTRETASLLEQQIAEQKKAEAALKDSEEKFRLISEQSLMGIIIIQDDRVVYVNDAAAEITGHAKDQMISRTSAELIAKIHPDDADRIRGELVSHGTGAETWHSSFRAISTTGEVKWVEQYAKTIQFQGKPASLFTVLDITEQVRIKEMMIQSEKMLSVGGLAAGMAHEINNPLAGIMQTAEVLTTRLTQSDIPANIKAAEEAGITMEGLRVFMEQRGILDMLNRIRESGKRAAEIVANMLSFARKSSSTWHSHNLASLLDQCVDLAGADYDLKKKYDFRQIEIVRQYEDNLPPVPCEQGKIQQVLLNILRNGAEAMWEASRGRRQTASRFVLRLFHEPEAAMVRIEIEDNGPGMDEATRRRVFEPFFTTKPRGRGTGLGLSVSYFIITKNHGGEMSVESTKGKGTLFRIRLPYAKLNA